MQSRCQTPTAAVPGVVGGLGGFSPARTRPEAPGTACRLPNWQPRLDAAPPNVRAMPHPPLHEVARSVGATPDLIPVLGDLFTGLSALGSTPRRLAALLSAAGVTARSRVLDLACGKGAVAVELAARTGCRVVGVDACPDFLDAARAAARRRGVQARCTWIAADIRRWRPDGPFDASMMIGLDGLLDAARTLRRFTKPGGLYVVDDAIRDPRHPRARVFADVPDAAEAAAQVEFLGDAVERRLLLPRAAVASRSRAIVTALESAAARAAKSHPRLRSSLAAFVRRHRDAGRDLVGPLRPTIWVVRRGPV